MLITNLKIENFRNYNELNLNLNNKINIFYGNNAQGKTNIIESIFLCSIGKSFRTSKDKELVKFDKDFFRIEVQYKKSDRDGKIKIEYSDKKHILSATIYLKDIDADFKDMNSVWDAWVEKGFAPARACVEAKMAREALLVEISIVAAVK